MQERRESRVVSALLYDTPSTLMGSFVWNQMMHFQGNILGVQKVVTQPILCIKLMYNMGNYFLDI